MTESFEARTARAGMSDTEIRTFVDDFTEALVRLALSRVQAVDVGAEQFGRRAYEIAEALDWSDENLLAKAGIEPAWVRDHQLPHRALLHPDFVTDSNNWEFIRTYLDMSMVSEKARRVLFPNLRLARRPNVRVDVLLEEAKALNYYLNLVREAGLSGSRIITYAGDLRTHGQGQNDSGRIGAVGAAVAVLDALEEIMPGAVTSSYGTMPSRTSRTPADIVQQMSQPDYLAPRALKRTRSGRPTRSGLPMSGKASYIKRRSVR